MHGVGHPELNYKLLDSLVKSVLFYYFISRVENLISY